MGLKGILWENDDLPVFRSYCHTVYGQLADRESIIGQFMAIEQTAIVPFIPQKTQHDLGLKNSRYFVIFLHLLIGRLTAEIAIVCEL